MNKTRQLHELGQSVWLDNITRDLLTSGTLRRYIDDLAVTGLTSNPTIFNQAISNTGCYDKAIAEKARAGKTGEALFFELALEDLIQAADLFRPIHDATDGVDGWVSLEVSPLLAHDSAATIKAAAQLYARSDRHNIFIKIPGTEAGMLAIEASIFAGVPVNITLLFSREHYLAAAEAYMRGIEKRITAGLDPKVGCVASVFVSRWDVAVNDKLDASLRNRLGIAVAQQTHIAYRELLLSPRWRTLADLGALPQRVLWASTGSKDPLASDLLYVEALATADTINTLPEKTLLAFADHGRAMQALSFDAREIDAVLAQVAHAGIDINALAAELQRQGTAAFVASWKDLLDCVSARSAQTGIAKTE